MPKILLKTLQDIAASAVNSRIKNRSFFTGRAGGRECAAAVISPIP